MLHTLLAPFRMTKVKDPPVMICWKRSEYTGKILGWDSPSLSLPVASNTGSARGFLRGLVGSLLGAGATLVQPGQSRHEDEWDRELRQESHFHCPGGDCGGGGWHLIGVPVHRDNWDESFGGFFCRQDITRLMELQHCFHPFLIRSDFLGRSISLGCLTKHTHCKPGLYI